MFKLFALSYMRNRFLTNTRNHNTGCNYDLQTIDVWTMDDVSASSIVHRQTSLPVIRVHYWVLGFVDAAECFSPTAPAQLYQPAARPV